MTTAVREMAGREDRPNPLGCTGAKLSVQLFNELERRDKKYGMVTMCVGTGQGAAGIFELL